MNCSRSQWPGRGQVPDLTPRSVLPKKDFTHPAVADSSCRQTDVLTAPRSYACFFGVNLGRPTVQPPSTTADVPVT